MEIIKQEILDDFKAVLDKHQVNQINKPFLLGQIISRLGDCHITNNFEWSNSGMMYDYLSQNNAKDTIINLAKKLNGEIINYNDTDCNVTGKEIIIPQKCLECDNNLLFPDKKIPEYCDRCNNSKIDPEYVHKIHSILHDNHGSFYYFYVKTIGTTNIYNIHCRFIGETEQKITDLFKELNESAVAEKYRADSKYLRYLDKRDKGFVFSFECMGEWASGEVDQMAPYCSTIITEHLVIF